MRWGLRSVRPPMKLYQPPMRPRRGFGKDERRIFCPCELCRMRFGRMLYNRVLGGDPLNSYRPGGSLYLRRRRFASFDLKRRIRNASARIGERVKCSVEARAFYDDWN